METGNEATSNLERVAVYSSHEGVAIGTVVAAVVVGLHDHALLPSVAAAKDHHHLACLHDLAHGGLALCCGGSVREAEGGEG